MLPLLQSVVYLRSSEGAILVLKDKEMWIGRGSFELSDKARTFCSRKQAYLKDTNTGVQLECHGLNSIYFLICQAASFQADIDTALSNLYTLKKGEVVKLTDGDKFFLAPKECLLTVCIKQIRSGQGGTVGELTHSSAHQGSSQIDLHLANEDIGHKLTSTNQDFRISTDEQHTLPPTVEPARAASPELGVLPQISGQGSLVKATASENSSLCGLSNNPKPADLHAASKTVEALSAPGVPPVACLPTVFLQVPGLAGSSSKVGGSCHNSGRISFGDFQLVNENVLPSRDSLSIAERDCNASERCDDGNGNGSQLLTCPSKPDQPREAVSSEDVCMLDAEQAQLHSLQTCHSNRPPDFSSPLPNPSTGYDGELCQDFGKSVSPDMNESHRNIPSSIHCNPVTTPVGKNQSTVSGGLPLMGNRESDVLGDRRTSPEQLELTSPENRGNSLTVASAQVDTQPERVGPGVSTVFCNGPIQGMDSVIATVSGYDNLVRARIINLINTTGAAYTGSLTQSNTHVVCWKFKGSKYELAKKLGKSIINHRWFEECLKAGKRLPEGPYKSCGEAVEPLSWIGTGGLPPQLKDSCIQEQAPGTLCKEETFHHQFGSTLGESSVRQMSGSKIAGHCGQAASASRVKSGILDKGKRVAVIDLSSPDDELGSHNPDMVTNETEANDQVRMAGAGAVEVLTVSETRNVPQQESDDFWNEVIRVCDTGDQGGDQLFPDVHPSSGLKIQKTRRTSRTSSIMGSFSGDRKRKSEFQITYGRRNEISTEARSSGEPQSGGLQHAMRSFSLAREQSGNVHDEDDEIHCVPQILSRKRMDVSGGFSGQSSGKYRRLMRKGGRVGLSSELLDQEQNAVVITGGIETGEEATSTTLTLQTRGHTPETDELQQCPGVLQTKTEADCKSEENADVSESPPSEIACVICHSDTKPNTEGVLSCGHIFCYPCIQRWADEAQKSKLPTCPLCKVPFDFITFRETRKDGISAQVLEEKVVQLGMHVEQQRSIPSLRTDNLCISCGSTDTPQLLLICTICRERACHTFCLDPPRPPGSSWYCSRCSHAHSRIQVREAYRRIFPGSSQAPIHRIPDVSYVGMNQDIPHSDLNSGGELTGARSSRIPMRRARQNNLRNYLLRDRDSNDNV